MRMKVITGITLTLFLASLLCVVFDAVPVTAVPDIIRVPEDYERVQWALGNASDGDTILVAAGTYYEHVTIDKSLTLIGEDPSTTIIDGDGTGTVVSITADNVNISRFTVQNSGWWYVGDCGIHLDDSDKNTLSNNIITSNNGYGVWLDDSGGNTLRDNNMSGNKYNFGVSGFSLSDFMQDIDTSNTVNGKPIYYLTDQRELLIDPSTFPDVGYLGLVNSINVTVRGLNLMNNFQGMLFAYTTDSTIENFNASNNFLGIYLTKSSNNTVSANNANNNDRGIVLEWSSMNTITDNMISNNYDGIWLGWSWDNKIVGNTLTSNNYSGIRLQASDNNLISSNIISNNSDGISLQPYSNDNTFHNNTISTNERGIFLWHSGVNNTIIGNTVSNNDYGIDLYKSDNNTVYCNNFINNVQQASSEESVNAWDNGDEGNHWSDFTGVDADGDGIGDTPYVIDANNTDRYPLIVPVVWNYYNPIPVVWEGVIYPVALSSNSTISMFKFNQPQMQISLEVTGPSGTIGFSNVTIPKSLLKDSPWTVTIDGQPPIDFILTDNATHSFVYLTYTHASTRHIIIQGTSVIPEFPAVIILPLFMIFTLIAVMVARKRKVRYPKLGG